MTTDELLEMLHPATLPMLKRMFEDFKRDAKDDGRLEWVSRADEAIASVDRVMRIGA